MRAKPEFARVTCVTYVGKRVLCVLCAVNLATALKCVAPDKSVALLDADVFGPSVPLMMDLRETPLLDDGTRVAGTAETRPRLKFEFDLQIT